MLTQILYFSGGYEVDAGNQVSVIGLADEDQIKTVIDALVSLHLRDTALRTTLDIKSKGWAQLEIQLLPLSDSLIKMKDAKYFIVEQMKR